MSPFELSLRRMSFRTLVIAVTFLCIFGMALQFSMDLDTWWHLRTGELILERGAIPATDSFSYTREGQLWGYPSTAWLSEVQLFLIYDAFGPLGLNLWVATLVTLAFYFIYIAFSGPSLLKAFLLISAALVSGLYWAARPYMLSFVLVAVFIWILEDFRWKRHNRLIWLPVLMVVWVNSHPGFAIGFLLLCLYLFDEAVRWMAARYWRVKKQLKESHLRLRALGPVLVALLLAAILNPSGLAVYNFPLETVSIGVLRDAIQEWQSPDFHTVEALPFAGLLLLLLGVLGVARQRLVLSDFLLVAGFGLMGLLAARNIPLFALAAPLVLARHAEPWLQELSAKFKRKKVRKHASVSWQRGLNAAIVVVVALLVVARAAIVATPAANAKALNAKLPVAAVDFIQRQQPPGTLYNSYNWGGYLIWELRDYPVYVDGRTDLYADGILNEWLNTMHAKTGWQATLDRWEVRLVLIEPSWPLAKLLPYEGWQLLYKDELAVVYGR